VLNCCPVFVKLKFVFWTFAVLFTTFNTHTIMVKGKPVVAKKTTAVNAPAFKALVKKAPKISKAQAAKLAAAKDNDDYDDGEIDDAAPAPVFMEGVTMTDDVLATKVQAAHDAGYDKCKKELTDLKKKNATLKENNRLLDQEKQELKEQIDKLKEQKTRLKEQKKELKVELDPLTVTL